VVAGLGAASRAGAAELHDASAAAIRAASACGARRVAVHLPHVAGLEFADGAGRVVEGLLLGLYRFDRFRTEAAATRGRGVREIVLAAGAGARAVERASERARIVAGAVAFARDLVNLPAGHLTPAVLAAEARRAVKGLAVRVIVLGRRALERERMGALLAVARGSDEEPRLVHLAYRPKGRARARLVFVGKGVTFDAGGYNLKTGDNMDTMKCDMAGAAAVIGAVRAVARLGLPVEVHGLIGAVENLVSGRAFKPGDVLVTRAGRTVEINNTDAEGRLVLADLLDYARTKLKPDAVVDLATLTGACVVALGPTCTGLFSNDDGLAARLDDAARRAGESIWRLPLIQSYRDQLESPVADVRNSGTRWGGAITAALFLESFVAGSTPWAHLDIAGPAFLESDHPYWGKGGTGAGVAALVEYAALRAG
jgi:leucyl aminopeptidase